MLSPFFPDAIFSHSGASVVQDRVFPGPRVGTLRQPLSGLPVYPTVEAAEEAFLAAFPISAYIGPVNAETFRITLIQYANIIATRSQRNAGNITLMNPIDVENLCPDLSHLNPVGRWSRLQEGIFSSDAVAPGEVYVLYVGDTDDAPASLVEIESGFVVAFLINTTQCVSDAQDYVQRLKFTTIE